jgi:hypothetical protein
MRWKGMAIVLSISLMAGACSRSGSEKAVESDGSTVNTPTECAGVTLEATDTGVTAAEISIEVMADTGSPLAPGLFQANIDAIQAFAKQVNANGGIGCRQLKVDVWDTKLDAAESKNGQINACQRDLALVGGNSLFNPDVTALDTCADSTGQPIGLPNFAALANDQAEQCAKNTWNLSSVSVTCGGPTTGQQTFNVENGSTKWINQANGGDLHGLYLVPSDLPNLSIGASYILQAQKDAGIDPLDGFKVSGSAAQSDYTRIVQELRSTDANYVANGSQGPVLVKMRKEAAAQGLNSIKAWWCTSACYSDAFANEGDVVDGTWIALPNLPFEEASTNAALNDYVQAVPKPDGFGVTAWSAGLLFKETIDRIVASDGPNAITRAKVLQTMMAIDNFDAGGIMGPKGPKTAQGCSVVLQLEQGTWQRRHPDAAGTLDCTVPDKIVIDPQAVAATFK